MLLKHILLLRTDHLGDMLLTLPMATAIKTALPSCRVSVLASAANAAAAQHHPHVDHVEIDPQEAKGSSLRGGSELARRLRALQCDAAVVVHATPRLAVATYLARVPIRVGTAYRAYSLLFNRRVRQHRRASSQHEAVLNVELLRALGIGAIGAGAADLPRALWHVEAQDRDSVAALLRRRGIAAQRFVVLHPGSAGSSMNWAPRQYAELGCALAGTGVRVVVSGGPTETALTQEVAAAIGARAIDLGGCLTIAQLAALLEQATAYVGSSTGPTHLAAAVGTPVIGLYPPLRSTLPRRWRPLGDDVVIFQPEVGQVCAKCLRERCPFFHCMEKHLDVATVTAAVRKALGQ